MAHESATLEVKNKVVCKYLDGWSDDFRNTYIFFILFESNYNTNQSGKFPNLPNSGGKYKTSEPISLFCHVWHFKREQNKRFRNAQWTRASWTEYKAIIATKYKDYSNWVQCLTQRLACGRTNISRLMHFRISAMPSILACLAKYLLLQLNWSWKSVLCFSPSNWHVVIEKIHVLNKQNNQQLPSSFSFPSLPTNNLYCGQYWFLDYPQLSQVLKYD